ncbi:PQQ-dependent dehydrogenase, methanol/ethanol family [Steroidobacter flavus]|uniref:PQQ-dependent dehydrogenase, methanol/ethanol family n=1 Tax=Steroidobacter flavus TaxID=1842136 RepID=A0ABV8T4C5_9GAMM
MRNLPCSRAGWLLAAATLVTNVSLAQSGDEAWQTGGNNWRQNYFSPLKDIDPSNVDQLGFAWQYDIDFDSMLEATPVVVDGTLYTSGSGGIVYALDPVTGKQRWKFEPKIDPSFNGEVGYGLTNRGVAVANGKVYVGAIDGWLYALNATNGSVAWKVDTINDRNRAYSITGAPYIAGKRVVIGNAGSELDARGYVTAYDLETGKQAWRFFTVPGDPKKGFEHPELKEAAKTWSKDSRWDVGLGGTAWDGMAYDPELNIIYVGTGNGAPWDRNVRSPGGGDNLFLSCILAINVDTGRLLWHYQTTPRDTWDYTATQKMVLADITIDSRPRKVVMQAPKNGFFYVLDRQTGELLSAKPYTKVTWASGIDMKTGRPIETGSADYTNQPRLVTPGPNGARAWQPMSYNSVTGLVYIPVFDTTAVFATVAEKFQYKKKNFNEGVHRAVVLPDGELLVLSLPEGLKFDQPLPRPKMFLRAWDPVTQKAAWEVDITGTPEKGAMIRRPGGVMSTASELVFQGDLDGHFKVFHGRTGAQLRDINVGTSIMAAPMTYKIDGVQYVAVMAGIGAYPGYADYHYGNKGRVVAFKLGGGDVPQRPLVSQVAPPSGEPPLPDTGTPEQIASGKALFAQHCAMCHANGRAPDLTRSNAATHAEFKDIVLKGGRSAKGMPNFAEVISEKDAQAIQAFIIHAAAKQTSASTTANGPNPAVK